MIHIRDGLSIAPLSITLTNVNTREAKDQFGERILEMVFSFRCLERDTGKPIDLEVTQVKLLDYEGEPLDMMVRRILCDAMCHEVSEVLQKNGKRIREPHP